MADRMQVPNVMSIMRGLVVFMLVFASWAGAEVRFDIAVIEDGPGDRLNERNDVYVGELKALTQNEFDVRIRFYAGNWNQASIMATLDKAYADPQIDMLLVTGFIANQLASMRQSFTKPTFLPVLLDARSIISPAVDRRSGIANLNYLTVYSDFGEDLDAMGEVVEFDKLVLLMDEELSSVIPELKAAAVSICAKRGIEFVQILHDGIDHRLVDRVPVDTGAIFLAGLPRMPADAFTNLVDAINDAGIPSYSFVGADDVQRGLLMTSSESRDITRQARLNALNMQAVMLGDKASDQPVSSPSKKQFTINMATARMLGVSPSFDVMNASVLLHAQATSGGQQFGLLEIAHEAIARNQDLLAKRLETRAGSQETRIARSALMPQLGLSASHDLRDVSPLVEAGLFAERSSDGALSVQQLIYSDSAAANVTIQQQLQLARAASLHETMLSTVQAATSAYYGVLNARSQLAVQENNVHVTRRNLQLAQNRVELGSSSAADVYRWQAEEARAQILLLNARATLKQGWNRLNRLLHRPQSARFALREAGFDEPFVVSREEFESMVSSPADYAQFSQFFINRGLGQAPELQQIDAQLAAKRRELTSVRRAYWLPDFSVSGGYTSNFGKNGPGLITGENQDDWTVGLQATLPLFSGGQKRARVSRASLELQQLVTLRLSIAEIIEEEIRRQLHAAEAAYGRIALTEISAESSRKNYGLVADAYARGTVSIIQLLDAQEASLTANAASIDSLYNFLTIIMAVQKAVGGFDFLLPLDQRTALASSLRAYLKRNKK